MCNVSRQRLSSDACAWSVPRPVECVAVALGLAKIMFAPPSPNVAASWVHSLCPSVKLWLNILARPWAFGDHPLHRSSFFPAAKLALFLYQEFPPDPGHTKDVDPTASLFPLKPPVQIASPIDNKAASVMIARRLQWRFVLDPLIFHAGSSLRYIWEVPRWRSRVS